MEGERGGSGRMSSRLRQCEPPAAKGREGKEKEKAAGAEMDKPGSFLKRFGRGGARGGDWRVFEVLCFSSAKADVVDHVGTYIHPVQRWRKSSYSPIRLPCLLPPSLVQVSAMRPCTCDSWLIGYITESSSMTRTHSVNRGEEGIRDTASIRTPVLSS